MQVNTGGGVQRGGKKKEGEPYRRNGIGFGALPHPMLYRKDFTQQLSLFVIFNPLL